MPGTAAGGSDRGLTLLEVVIVVGLLLVISVPFGKLAHEASRACTSLSLSMHFLSRGVTILDRLEIDLLQGNFASMVPAVPAASPSIEFQKIAGVENGYPVFGNPIRIDMVPREPNAADGKDDDGDSLIDEHELRIWEDRAPFGQQPGAEDDVSILHANLTKGGLSFTRQGAVLMVELTFQEAREIGMPPVTFTLRTAVKMRNNL